MYSYTNDDLIAAVKRVLAGETRRAISTATLIPYRTLCKWVKKGKHGVFREPVRRGPAPMLSAPAEEYLVEWVIGRQIVGHPASRKENIYKAGTMSAMAAGHTIGAGWYRRFMNRHPILASRTSQAVTKARNSVTTDDTMLLFYSLVKAVAENNLDASRVSNMDETAFQSTKGSKRVVGVRSSRNVWHQDVALNFHLTLIACGSASGVMVPPLFVLPGATVKLQVLDGCDVPGAVVTTTDSGFMNGPLFVEWLRFFADSVPTNVQRPLLLIMDGCSSHYSVDIILAAERLGALLLLLPPNATHLLQPLDVAVFSSFKAKLRRLTEVYVGKTGANSIDKEEAIKMASTAWQSSNMGANVKAGFVGCGIFPPSKPKMDACVKNFRRNGTPETAKLSAWLRIKDTVQKEVLVLPPLRKRVRKTAIVSGRLFTREALDSIRRPPKKTKKATKTKKTRSISKAGTAEPMLQAVFTEVVEGDDVVLQAIV